MGPKKQKDAGVNRRDFLKKGATAGVGVGALVGLGVTGVEAQRNARDAPQDGRGS